MEVGGGTCGTCEACETYESFGMEVKVNAYAWYDSGLILVPCLHQETPERKDSRQAMEQTEEVVGAATVHEQGRTRAPSRFPPV